MTLNLLVIYINIGKRSVPAKEPAAIFMRSRSREHQRQKERDNLSTVSL